MKDAKLREIIAGDSVFFGHYAKEVATDLLVLRAAVRRERELALAEAGAYLRNGIGYMKGSPEVEASVAARNEIDSLVSGDAE